MANVTLTVTRTDMVRAKYLARFANARQLELFVALDKAEAYGRFPGQYESLSADLEFFNHTFGRPYVCPVYQCLKRVGIDVFGVWSTEFEVGPRARRRALPPHVTDFINDVDAWLDGHAAMPEPISFELPDWVVEL